MKTEFRKECLEKRNKLKPLDLTKKILNLKEYKECKTVFIYVSNKSEISTIDLIIEELKE